MTGAEPADGSRKLLMRQACTIFVPTEAHSRAKTKRTSELGRFILKPTDIPFWPKEYWSCQLPSVAFGSFKKLGRT
jgi:hypothetical protein